MEKLIQYWLYRFIRAFVIVEEHFRSSNWDLGFSLRTKACSCTHIFTHSNKTLLLSF